MKQLSPLDEEMLSMLIAVYLSTGDDGLDQALHMVAAVFHARVAQWLVSIGSPHGNVATNSSAVRKIVVDLAKEVGRV